jgi:4-hydroxy-2-oxoheptanedioate aldolase
MTGDAHSGPQDGVVARSTARLRELWSRDEPAFGLWSILPDPTVAELLAASAFDYVCLDLQHGIAGFTELPELARAMRSAGRAPVVRVPWNEPAAIMRALDVGAHAVIVPMVSTADEARRAVAACRYPPAGARSWGPIWGDLRADGAPPPAAQDDAVLCLVMVETREGVEALEEIVRVPGVDGVYVGPNDLALTGGFGRGTYRDDPGVEALIERIVRTCRDAGVVAGLHCSDVEMAQTWSRRGVRMLTSGQDSALLRDATAAVWAELTPSRRSARSAGG